MEVKDYAKYVLMNMPKASCGNALNITSKFNDGLYKFDEFLNELVIHTNDYYSNKVLTQEQYYDIIALINSTLKKYNSGIKYSKVFIYDDFIIDFWRIIHGY